MPDFGLELLFAPLKGEGIPIGPGVFAPKTVRLHSSWPSPPKKRLPAPEKGDAPGESGHSPPVSGTSPCASGDSPHRMGHPPRRVKDSPRPLRGFPDAAGDLPCRRVEGI